MSAARNLGVRQSRGRLIAFLDSDDLWQPDKLQDSGAFHGEFVRKCRFARPMRFGFAMVSASIQGSSIANRLGTFLSGVSISVLVSPSAVMMTRELFERSGGFDESLPVCEDYDLWLRIARDYPVPLIEQRFGRQAWRPCRPAVPFDLGHGSLSRERRCKSFCGPASPASGARGVAGSAKQGRRARPRGAQARQSGRR